AEAGHGVHPIRTVPLAITVPAGRSAGSLQVLAMSPMRAAALPLISTVAEPARMVALFDGDFWNGPAVGMWLGGLVAVQPWVGAGPPGRGAIGMWMSVARMRSPSFAAGRLMVALPRSP